MHSWLASYIIKFGMQQVNGTRLLLQVSRDVQTQVSQTHVDIIPHVHNPFLFSMWRSFGPYTIQAWTSQCVNLHSAIKALFGGKLWDMFLQILACLTKYMLEVWPLVEPGFLSQVPDKNAYDSAVLGLVLNVLILGTIHGVYVTYLNTNYGLHSRSSHGYRPIHEQTGVMLIPLL